jgi:hypothetical protein
MAVVLVVESDTAMPSFTATVPLVPPTVQNATFTAVAPVSSGSPIGTMLVNGSPPMTWAIIAGNDAGNFAIVSNTGTITAAVNISTPQNFSLTVQATNLVGVGTATATINVLIAPAVPNATFNLVTPVSSGTVVGTMTTTAGTTPITWAITAGNGAGNFVIDSGSGQITTAATISTAQIFSLTVQATNIVGAGTATATINVVVEPTGVYVTEDGSAGYVTEDGTATYIAE